MDLYKEEFHQIIEQVLQSGQYVRGPQVAMLEQELSQYVEVPHAIACGSGTMALQGALFGLGVGPGDEVIVPGFTFVATAGAVKALGATPIFADIHPTYYTIDPKSVVGLLGKKTRAIITASLFGQMGLIADLEALSREYGIPVIEDGAQSFGATHRGQKSGSVLTVGTTSFFPTKVLGGIGEGGGIFTHSWFLDSKIRKYLSHGTSEQQGINGRMSELQAALLRVKLRHLPQEITRRREIAHEYDQTLTCNRPSIFQDCTSVYAQYCVQSFERDFVRGFLAQKGIPTEVYYLSPLCKYGVFGSNSLTNCPIAEDVCTKIFSIPMHAYMTKQEVNQVCTQLFSVVQQQGRL